MIQTTGVLTIEIPGNDADSDGLNDFVEQRIGTSELLADSDGDLISDQVEVTGFTFDGKQWYPNPLEVDSNGDGIADTLEYDIDGIAGPDDTDGDQVPNLFDNDNDGDGVADRVDLAPFAKSSFYGESTPLLLKVDNLTGNNSNNAVTTFVDFQVRPQSLDQLQFAFNLLDWPQDDKGQIRAVDDQPENMKLLPMLEIRIPNGATMLPPQSDLDPYSIAVGDGEAAGEKVAYLPLSLVTDQQSGERVAFGGRMRYLPQAAWQSQEVRLVWMVQMDNDLSCDYEDTEDRDNGCTKEGYFLNRGQIVHRYYENWRLTGLNVTEDHGAKIAVIYEDPSQNRDPEPDDDGPTWLLSTVLEERFLKPIDSGGNLQREVTMDNLVANFDWNTIGAGTAETIYGLPNHFKVTPVQEYPTFDTAINGIGSVISDTVLTAFNSADKPLLTFAYETNVRSVGLDVMLNNSSYASFSNDQRTLTINFHPSGQVNTHIDTTAGFKWNPYCNTGGAPNWAVCDTEVYWQELEARYGNHFFDPDTLTVVSQSDQDADVARAMMLVTQLYLLTIQQGLSNIVRQDYGAGDIRNVSGLIAAESDTVVESYVRDGLKFTGQVAKFAANWGTIRLFNSIQTNHPTVINQKVATYYDNILKVDSQGTISKLKSSAFLSGAAVVLVLGSITAVALAIAGYQEAADAVSIAIGVAQVTLSVAVPLRMASVGANVAGQSFSQVVLKGLSESIAYTKVAAYVGAGIAIGITWGFFIYSIVSNDVAVGSPEFNSALAETIAATILIILLTVLAFTVVGLIIVGIITAVDVILTLICKLGVDELKTDFTGGCFTLSAAATKVIAKALYNYELMINTSKKDLVTFGPPDLTLADPNLGYAEGNGLSITIPITTHAVHKDPEVTEGLYINFYLWLFNKGNLRSSTFKFSATHPDSENISNLERDQITSKWFQVREDHKYVLTPMYGGFYTTTVTVDNMLLQAGLNQPAKFYHNMGFAIPAYECWVAPVPLLVSPVTPVCYTRTFKSKTSEPVETIVFDIFPASLDQFITLGVGPTWDPAFRPLQDSDGDGLLAARYGGLDPDDSKWDTDGDGLSDGFEQEQRQAGIDLALDQQDGDLDGLTDAQELLYGTNPAVADSDNDGLKDGQEIWHQNMATGVWEGGLDVRINSQIPRTVHVSSDANARDSDGDGVSDGAEYQLALDDSVKDGKLVRLDDNNVPYHPNVVNTPPVRIYLTSDAVNNRYVAPGQQFIYTTTVVATAPLNPGVLDLDVRDNNDALTNLLGVTSARYGLPFTTAPTVTLQTNFTVASNAQTQTSVSVNNSVRTLLAGSGPGPWQLAEPGTGSWPSGSTGYPPRFTTVAPNTLGSSDYYQTASKNPFTTSSGSTGEVWTRDFGFTQQYQLDTDVFTRTLYYQPNVPTLYQDRRSYHLPNRPDIACNGSGTCMVVWDYIDACSTVTIDSLTVLAKGNDGGDGIEPVIYLVRASNSDLDPTDGGYQLLWSARQYYNPPGNNVPKDTTLGPNANGFPITIDICNGGALAIYESDDQDNLDDYDLTIWGDQHLMGRFDFPREGGFWEDANDTKEVTFSSGCGGCSYKVKITNPSRQIHKVAGVLLGPDGTVLKQQFDLSSYDLNPRTVEFYRPTVATDGNEFLVAWERSVLPLGVRNAGSTSVSESIVFRRFAANGAPLTDNTGVNNSDAPTTITVATGNELTSRSRARLVMDWVGDRYLLTRMLSPLQVNATGEWGQGITIRELDASGQLRAGTSAQQLIGTARAAIDDAYDWDYDPINNRGLLAYWEPSNRLIGRLFQPTGPGTYNVTVPSVSDIAFSGDAGSPQVEYDPATKGWMVGWTGSGRSHFEALDAEANVRLVAGQNFQNSPLFNSNALACPAPQSLPLVDLRYEELPGATTFVDSSGYGNNASCSGNGCPAAGAPGALSNAGDAPPLSAYALEFNGTNNIISMPKPNQLRDSLSLAFWYKANEGSFASDPFVIESNQPSGFGLFVRNNQNQVEWHVANKSVLRASIADGDWHFIVGTYDRSTGALNLYVDGVRVQQNTTATQAPILGSNIEIRGANTQVGIDHLQIYQTALNASTVQDIFARSNNAFCLGTSGSDATVPGRIQWQTLAVSRQESFAQIEESATSNITVDNDAPTASVAGVQYVEIDDSGSAVLTIGGTAQDPTSGIDSVAVSVDGINGGAYQPANGRESWVYQFPVTEGAYTIRAKATDLMGIEGASSADTTIIADATPPQVTIDAIANPAKPVLNNDGNWQVSLSGTASDPAIGTLPGSGVYPNSVQVRLVGSGGVAVSDQWQTATYDENSKAWTIDYLFPAARLDVTGVYTVSVRAEDRAGSNGGNRTGDTGATAIVHLDNTGPAAALSVAVAARQLITEPITIGGPVISPISGVNLLEVAFTPIERIAALPTDVSADEAQSLLDAADPNRWLTATLVQQGVGITSTTWSLPIPATLEGEYQIDLRGTDVLGNVLVTSNVWRGIIDLLAPRVSIVKTNTGSSYTSRPFVQPELIKYECVAEDRYLTESDFVCLAKGVQEPTRFFNTDPLLQTLFPDRTIVERIENTYYRWETSSQPEAIEACDIFGQCSTASTGQMVTAAQSQLFAASTVSAAAAEEPKALVISPVEGRYVAASGGLSVTIVAESAAALQQVTVELDGNLVTALTFAQSANITRTQRTVAIPNVAEGVHTLVAKATDWTNAVQTTLYPVTFTLDAAPPTVTLDTDLLRLADTWALGSDMLRFHGTASDSVGLAAVQIKIGDASFVEAGFDENTGTWSTAQLVPDPEGKNLEVAVRAIDRAGRITDVSGAIGVDLTPTDIAITLPDTTITETTAISPSAVNSVSFNFAGVDGTNEVAAFECRLDEGQFQPCVSPQTYDGLNNGLNRFEVRAIDDEGFVDLFPASKEWTIAVTTLQTTITEAPSPSTDSRDANFVFNGSAGVTGFECALDGGAYTSCDTARTVPRAIRGCATVRTPSWCAVWTVRATRGRPLASLGQ